MTHLTYPNESAEYRAARNALLAEEMALREHIEAVAARRRALPPGGTVPEDYVFERIGKNDMPESVRMSSLFGQHRTLILYSFMYGPERDTPCPMCTLLLDSVNGAAAHIDQRASLYVVAKSPIARLVAWARDRGWSHLRFVSTAGNVMTPTISETRRSFPRRCGKSTTSRRRKTTTRPRSTCFVSTTA